MHYQTHGWGLHLKGLLSLYNKDSAAAVFLFTFFTAVKKVNASRRHEADQLKLFQEKCSKMNQCFEHKLLQYLLLPFAWSAGLLSFESKRNKTLYQSQGALPHQPSLN
ncbi:hypothetical protein [Rubrolithibacter danxiaensis]|uniref:hypothetical protein n=1 Tax=Rubrolithibacter danxiaensis TaxID=3390805 RepID=UPI003BF78BD3